MGILSIILQALLGLGFLMFGFMKFGSKQMVDEFRRYGYSGGFRVFTGLVEVIAAAIIIWGIWNDTLAAWGAALVVVTMLGAILTHMKVKDAANKMMMPILLLILGIIVLVINFGALTN
ncbi:DoxX family protein [Paenibacillus qinlingensis]|uniref:Membrane protein YphA (DoxX/SURF4 family) n=1 Tax=Paenibacillus qinlingensis TaxID=1837343 RepID=A0ABU1NRV7_9BACL|nr:DoxX family protein [Paenibacillus qinlingensis]MDR6550201.1 putative membrane protein YphA (DoxX/SURF4 family) [Paenibacillus qinlingensis]